MHLQYKIWAQMKGIISGGSLVRKKRKVIRPHKDYMKIMNLEKFQDADKTDTARRPDPRGRRIMSFARQTLRRGQWPPPRGNYALGMLATEKGQTKSLPPRGLLLWVRCAPSCYCTTWIHRTKAFFRNPAKLHSHPATAFACFSQLSGASGLM